MILFVNDWETANREHDFAVQALKNAGTFVRLVRIVPLVTNGQKGNTFS